MKPEILVKEVDVSMFVPQSEHVQRLGMLGKTFTEKTLQQKRCFIDFINAQFGERPLASLTLQDVIGYLMSVDRSGSWKNTFIGTLKAVYQEAAWQGMNVVMPPFPHFKRNSKKADVLTTEELNRLFRPEHWPSRELYLLYLCTFTCGLRLGEARGLLARQIDIEKRVMVIDGFCRDDGFRTDYCKKGWNEDKKWRVVTIPDITLSQIEMYLRERNLSGEMFLFTRNGNIIRREYAETEFKKVLKRVHIEKGSRRLVPHSLRFSYVTRMRRNAETDLVRRLVGHTTIEQTEYYTRVVIPEMIDAVTPALPAANKLFQ
ncbi:MAG: site-specific integrase [Treponema sp.]|nr:site-specific integrase [Treponema sp.]